VFISSAARGGNGFPPLRHSNRSRAIATGPWSTDIIVNPCPRCQIALRRRSMSSMSMRMPTVGLWRAYERRGALSATCSARSRQAASEFRDAAHGPPFANFRTERRKSDRISHWASAPCAAGRHQPIRAPGRRSAQVMRDSSSSRGVQSAASPRTIHEAGSGHHLPAPSPLPPSWCPCLELALNARLYESFLRGAIECRQIIARLCRQDHQAPAIQEQPRLLPRLDLVNSIMHEEPSVSEQIVSAKQGMQST
jgi:hypothetical protein